MSAGCCAEQVIFPYFDDVNETDGGVFVFPGSHKSDIVRPGWLFGSLGQDRRAAAEAADSGAQLQGSEEAWLSWGGRIPEGSIKPTFRAGDILIMPEATLHCVKPWATEGRPRRALMLRHGLQHDHGSDRGSPEQRARMHALTQEFMDFAEDTETKAVARMSAGEIAVHFDRAEAETRASDASVGGREGEAPRL